MKWWVYGSLLLERENSMSHSLKWSTATAALSKVIEDCTNVGN